MGTKLNPGMYDCYAKALPDEPFFVLLARDVTAPMVVIEWTRENPSLAPEKRNEAMDCAAAMMRWRNRNPRPEGGYPKPPATIFVSEQQGRQIYDKLWTKLGITQFTGHSITLIREAVSEVLNDGAAEAPPPADAATVKDYEYARDSFLAHVRDLDVAMNGEEGAAKRPLIIDIKGQLLEAIRVRQAVDDAITAYVDGLLGRREGEVLAKQFVDTVSESLGRNPIREYDERRVPWK